MTPLLLFLFLSCFVLSCTSCFQVWCYATLAFIMVLEFQVKQPEGGVEEGGP